MKLNPISHKKLIKLLSLIEYSPVKQKGSHLILENTTINKIIVVPVRTKDIGVGLLSTILKEVELSREKYFDLLKKV